MKETIEQLLQQIEDYKEGFYPRIIELHNDSRLRLLVKTFKPYGIVIKPSKTKDGFSLYYRQDGFSLNEPKWISDYDYGGSYYDEFHNFLVKEDRLYAKNKELLDYFPHFKLEGVQKTIERKLMEGIKNLDIYKSATEKSRGKK